MQILERERKRKEDVLWRIFCRRVKLIKAFFSIFLECSVLKTRASGQMTTKVTVQNGFRIRCYSLSFWCMLCYKPCVTKCRMDRRPRQPCLAFHGGCKGHEESFSPPSHLGLMKFLALLIFLTSFIQIGKESKIFFISICFVLRNLP